MSRPAHFVAPWDLNRTLGCLPASPRAGSVVLVESVAKGRALPFHRKKLVFVLSAMHHFAQSLREEGYDVSVVTADSYVDGIAAHVRHVRASEVIVLEPREWGLARAMDQADFGVPLRRLDDGGPGGHFLLRRDEFAAWAQGRKQLRMADFYRWMRKRTGYLMTDGKPDGGRWSFDRDNRNHARGHRPPPVARHEPDTITRAIMERVAGWRNGWGSVDGFDWPVTRQAALADLDRFFAQRATHFGRFQDAILHGEPYLWHTLVSAPMNVSLLSPREVCERICAEHRAGRMPLASAEGLLRQVLGWREFVRGVYWLRMPQLRQANLLGAQRPLPDFYWDPERTDMACMRDAIGNVHETGYAHHIQRLMVLGNFALLAGVSPTEISHWFWAGFVDAYEWVELVNVLCMGVFADDTFATKPYAASGNYIHKMSDHCAGCRYDVKARAGPDACPFNALYWDFLHRHRQRFEGHPRMSVLYRNWDRWETQAQNATLASAKAFLRTLRPSAHGWTFDPDAG